jgi:hypothetical protein
MMEYLALIIMMGVGIVIILWLHRVNTRLDLENDIMWTGLERMHRQEEIDRLTMIQKGYRSGDTPLFYDPDPDMEAAKNSR